MGLKLDMTKAYDRMKCDYLFETLYAFGLTVIYSSYQGMYVFYLLLHSSKWVPLRECPYISRGLRQGESLSPCSSLCVEVFSSKFTKAKEKSAIQGVTIAMIIALIFLHLLFEDDRLLYLLQW